MYGKSFAFSADPYSVVHVLPIRNFWYRNISSNGYPHQIAPNRSGRCVIEAPISSPPFERPRIAKCSGEVYLFAIRYSAAANQSSNTFCFFSNIAALCQSSPYSSPPRRFGSANHPPRCSHHAYSGFQLGVSLKAKPPYPVINRRSLPSRFKPFFPAINIGTFVPSFDGKKTCFTSYWLESN